ncbi:MAG: UDP-3-O-(3-hydroxymyristoyl)glucosamine N-acyltransferase, partial [Limnobacter sp.]|nr:UDP-3-O-(3-hydroxymyristoyl)glucosamine N-acyltransferase [Limnobacter sp.]
MEFKPTTLAALVEQFGGVLHQTPGSTQQAHELSLTGFAPLASAASNQLSFLSNSKFKSDLVSGQAGAVLVKQADAGDLLAGMVPGQSSGTSFLWSVPDPYLAYAKIQQWWVKASSAPRPSGVHSSAVVEEGAQVSSTASVGANAVIERGAIIEEHAVVGAGCFIGEAARIGAYSLLHANVTVYHECQIGQHCIIHSGVVIGADGFGFANEKGAWVKIPQTGRVLIADQVEIGANTTVDRGALDDTLIGFGVKLDNQIMVAHNCTIGEHTAVAGCVGMAGTTHIGARCTIGG